MLADGCMVPACGVCWIMMENHKKVAQERGLYDTSKITRNTIRGGDYMTKVERKSEGGNYLKHKFVTEEGITSLKIENSGNDVEFSNTDKKSGEEKIVHK